MIGRRRLRESERESRRLQAAIDEAYGAMNASAYVGGPSQREAWQTATMALGSVVTVDAHNGESRPMEGRLSVTSGETDG